MELLLKIIGVAWYFFAVFAAAICFLSGALTMLHAHTERKHTGETWLNNESWVFYILGIIFISIKGTLL